MKNYNWSEQAIAEAAYYIWQKNGSATYPDATLPREIFHRNPNRLKNVHLQLSATYLHRVYLRHSTCAVRQIQTSMPPT